MFVRQEALYSPKYPTKEGVYMAGKEKLPILTDIINLDILQNLQDGFADAFELPSVISDIDGRPITRQSRFTGFCKLVRSSDEGRRRCEKFDSKLFAEIKEKNEIYIRRGCTFPNLITVAVPIFIGDTHYANFTVGQLVSGQLDVDTVKKFAREIGIDERLLAEAAEQLIPMEESLLENSQRFLKTVALQIEALGTRVLENKKLRAENLDKDRKLRFVEGEYEDLLNNFNEGYLHTNLNGDIVEANETIAEMLGYTHEELIDMNMLSLYGKPEERQALLDRLAKEKKIFNFELKLKKKSGNVLWTSSNVSAIEDMQGNFAGTKSLVRDITGEKETEKAMIAERKKYEAEILKARDEAEKNKNDLHIRNRQNKLNNERLESLLRVAHYQTGTVQELLDYVLDEAIKLTNSKIGYIYYYDEIKRQFILNTWSKDVMRECEVVQPSNVYSLDSTGCWGEAVRQRRPILINDYAAPNEMKRGIPEGHVMLKKFLTIPVIIGDEIVAVAGVANKDEDYDDTDIRQLSLLMDSAWKITERFRLIEDLKIAKNKAEESSKLKTVFLNNMSHEIRTPMNGIIGFSQFLNKPGITDENRNSYIKIIQNNSKKLLRIIEDILEVSDLQSIKKISNRNIVCLNDFLLSMYSRFEIQAKDNKTPIYIHNDISDKASTIYTDSGMLEKILDRLLDNAVKFTRVGNIDIGAKLRQGEGQSELEVYIKDTGIGIREESLDKVFDNFMQEETELTEIPGGLGIGLSIAKGYTELLGGKIEVESVKGEGSVFSVILPYSPVYGEAEGSKEPDKSDTPVILVAEDEEVNYLYIQTLIEDFCESNCRIIRAKNGLEAIEACKKNPPPSVVLMDMSMPKMDGYEATKIIKELNPNIPVIAQTAYVTSDERDSAFESGCDDLISKPIQLEQITDIIKMYFLKPESREEEA